jgi:hypothetical protein
MTTTMAGDDIPAVNGRMDRLFAAAADSRPAALALLLLTALITRCSVLGDWNYEIDVEFYLLAARRMLDGALLYVDLWDRKPPGLFLAYALAAALPCSILVVQVAATVCTALAGYGVQRIARPWAGSQGSVLAGLAYCAVIPAFGGMSGQAAVLFNPLMIACAWSVSTSLPELARGLVPGRITLGMVCAGLAIAMKQSAVFEGAAFGLLTLALARRGGAPPPRLGGRALLLALAGALPMLAAGAWYWHIGHFADLWQALVLSNAGRLYDSPVGMLTRYATMLQLLAPILLFAALGAAAMGPVRNWPGIYAISVGWLGVAAVGMVAYPGLFLHYALPLIAPLCLVAAPFLARRDLGLRGLALLAGAMLVHAGAFDFAARARSREASAQLVTYLGKEAPQHRVMAWNLSPWLLELTGSHPPTSLLFAPHLFDGAEAASSGRDTAAEVRRVLAWRPEAVVVQEPLPARPLNMATVVLVDTYVRQCRKLRRFTLYDHNGPQVQAVYTGCASAYSTKVETGR